MFRNDYSELCAPEVLAALTRARDEQNIGYGEDAHSARAARLILSRFGLSEKTSRVHFLAGGTQTNMTVISYFLRPYECVIAAESGHINVHETGAVEASGHKVVTVPALDGKLTPDGIRKAVSRHTDEHMVKPRMVYLSDTTETGTLYTRGELSAIRKVCDECGLLLFLDGARLGVALTAKENDLTPELLASLVDLFYVGGTKNGAMYGEAVVIRDASIAPDFRYHIKNRGAMLAKGFAVGIQFEALFENDLFFTLARHANETAAILREGLRALGIPEVGGSTTNQIFVRVGRDLAACLMDKWGCELWEDGTDTQVVRLVTSFATKEEDALALLSDMRAALA